MLGVRGACLHYPVEQQFLAHCFPQAPMLAPADLDFHRRVTLAHNKHQWDPHGMRLANLAAQAYQGPRVEAHLHVAQRARHLVGLFLGAGIHNSDMPRGNGCRPAQAVAVAVDFGKRCNYAADANSVAAHQYRLSGHGSVCTRHLDRAVESARVAVAQVESVRHFNGPARA